MTWLLGTFRSAAESFAAARLLGRRNAQERELLIAEARLHADRLGAEPLKVLQVNLETTRSVLLCRHPHFGQCILKSASPHGPPGVATAHVETVQRAESLDTGLFPRLYERGDTFTLEEFIKGETLHTLPKAEWRDVDLVEFFEDLRGCGAGRVSSDTINHHESALIAFRFTRKVLRAARYAVVNVRPWHIGAFAFPNAMQAKMDALLAQAEHVTLPRSIIPGDMATANVVLQKDSRRLYIVDVEQLREGFFGFDCVWLLAMLTRTNCPVEAIDAACSRVCTDEFARCAGGGALMRASLDFLLEVLGAYVGINHPARRAIRQLRSGALRPAPGEA